MTKNEDVQLKVVRCEHDRACQDTPLWESSEGWYCQAHLVERMAEDYAVRKQVLRDLKKGLLQIQITTKGRPKSRPSQPLRLVELATK